MTPLPRADFLMASELAQISDDVLGLFADSQLSMPITYRSFQSRTFTPSTGANVPTYTDYAIRAVRIVVPTREVQASQGLYQMGDLRFFIARSTLAATPDKEDVVIDGSNTYNLVSWDTDPLSQIWRVVARKVA